MHDVLRQRIIRRLETLPEGQLYQVLDYIEFLESKYAKRAQVEPGVLQKFAEGLEDKLRKRAMNPATLREAFQLISAADRVLADVSNAGKQILDELGSLAEPTPAKPRRVEGSTGSGGSPGASVGRTSAARPATGKGEPGPRPASPPRAKASGAVPPDAPGGADAAPDTTPDEVALGEEWSVHEPGSPES